jgi:hypothetical protein
MKALKTRIVIPAKIEFTTFTPMSPSAEAASGIFSGSFFASFSSFENSS